MLAQKELDSAHVSSALLASWIVLSLQTSCQWKGHSFLWQSYSICLLAFPLWVCAAYVKLYELGTPVYVLENQFYKD